MPKGQNLRPIAASQRVGLLVPWGWGIAPATGKAIPTKAISTKACPGWAVGWDGPDALRADRPLARRSIYGQPHEGVLVRACP